MAHGSVVADGPPTEIKAMVGTRTIRATLPGGRRSRRSSACPASARAERRGEAVVARLRRLRRGDPRAARRYPDARDIEISGAGLEEAFLELTAATTTRSRRRERSRYTRYELLRTLRNRRFFFFSLGFPLVLYFLIAGPNRNENDLGGTGLSAPLYFMVGLAAFGTMNAMLVAGARIAAERSVGWNRQLRITPLSAADVLPHEGADRLHDGADRRSCRSTPPGSSLGVSLPAGDWWRMTVLIVIGLIPFAALGILLGHLLTPDSIGPAMGGSTALLALLGGTWFPITGGVMQTIGEPLPSYWLVQASHVALGGAGWSTNGLDRDRRLDGRPDRARTPLLPARHQARLTPLARRRGRVELRLEPGHRLRRAPSRRPT